MIKKQLFLTILSGIIVASLLSIFSVTQGLFFTPQFEVDVENLSNNSTKIIMKNIGWSQAKNAIAFIDNTNNVKLVTDTCYEGSILNNQRTQYVIKFEKMSTNVDCTLFFNGNFKQSFSILVVADDTPGKSWSFKDQTDSTAFLIFTVFPIILGLAIVLTMGSTISFVYYTIIGKKRQENFKIRELELGEEIKSLKQEKRLLQNKQGSGRTPDDVEKDNKRSESLDEQISEMSFELDEIRTKMLSDKKTEKSIGAFYIKWSLLERVIVKLGDKHNIKIISLQFSSGIIMRKLSEEQIIDSETYSNYQNIRRFRNNIAHGLTTPTNKELGTKLISLDMVLTKIQDLMLVK